MSKLQDPAVNIKYWVHHLSQIVAITLAFLWFGWKGGIVIFLLAWSVNTVGDAKW